MRTLRKINISRPPASHASTPKQPRPLEIQDRFDRTTEVIREGLSRSRITLVVRSPSSRARDTQSPAPTVQNPSARGNAPGNLPSPLSRALKGRNSPRPPDPISAATGLRPFRAIHWGKTPKPRVLPWAFGWVRLWRAGLCKARSPDVEARSFSPPEAQLKLRPYFFTDGREVGKLLQSHSVIRQSIAPLTSSGYAISRTKGAKLVSPGQRPGKPPPPRYLEP
ncbi:hypothetical protein J3R74_002329 [Puniceicoccus vermicola]